MGGIMKSIGALAMDGINEQKATILLRILHFHRIGGIGIAQIKRGIERRRNLQIRINLPLPQMNSHPSARPSTPNDGTRDTLSTVASLFGVLFVAEAEVIRVGMHNHRAAPQILGA